MMRGIGLRRRACRASASCLVLSAAALVSSAPAVAVDQLPYSSLSPVGGASFVAQSQQGSPWMMTAPTRLQVFVRVSRTPAVGADGVTLSDLDMLDYFAMAESTTDPGVYQGVSGAGLGLWADVPGTYYWQVQASGLYPLSGPYVSPIFSIVIQAPPSISPGGQSTPSPPSTQRCRSGYTSGRIGGQAKCLRAGESCVWRYRRQYRRYHFACVRKGRHYRLVRSG
jgi:hypothetical protein